MDNALTSSGGRSEGWGYDPWSSSFYHACVCECLRWVWVCG